MTDPTLTAALPIEPCGHVGKLPPSPESYRHNYRADWWLRSGEAAKKGRPLTFGDFSKLAALYPQPASEALPRKLALSLYETWTFVLLWAVGQAQDRGGKMHRVHAAILARLHDAMTSAATAGLLLDDSTARLPGLLAEHGFDLEDLLRETAPVETKEPSHG
ncbi:hypothetical protein ACW7BJ_27485 [Azospirillum argentinense]